MAEPHKTASADSAQSLGRSTRLQPRSGILSSRIGDDMVLLDEEQGMYFGLNAVGARVLELAGQGLPLGDIHTELTGTFETDAETLWGDLLQFAKEMLKLGLMGIGPENDETAPQQPNSSTRC